MASCETNCRHCGTGLTDVFCDLGMQPLSNAYLDKESLTAMEPFFPLKAYVCHDCFLVQVLDVESPSNIFRDYAYFSSYSDAWLAHVADFAAMATERFQLNEHDLVVELASNDGCLLKNFVDTGISVLGVEPAENVAKVARSAGVPTRAEFFGESFAKGLVAEGHKASLLVANNVLAHVPDINDFVAGIATVLADDGVVSIEFPQLLKLIDENQFDTIYHEHFSYLSLLAVERILDNAGLRVFDVESLWTHGGSLRVFACHNQNEARATSDNVVQQRELEARYGLAELETYRAFSEQVAATKRELLKALIDIKESGKSLAFYGAPAKGNTLLNFCGIGTDFAPFTVDRNPHKQGLYLPGTHIPIVAPEQVADVKPDYLMILPWNFKDEIMQQMAHIRDWGGKFVIPIPNVQVL